MKHVPITLLPLTTDEFRLITPQAVALYIDAMGYHRSMTAGRIEHWKRDSLKPGFHAIAAVEGRALAGIAYGFNGAREYWWDKHLRQAAPQPSDLDTSRYFELAEIHVDPANQNRGLGRRLLTELLALTDQPTVLLSTPEIAGEHNAAFGLYRSLGFVDVARHYRYPTDQRPFAILGRRLPLTAS